MIQTTMIRRAWRKRAVLHAVVGLLLLAPCGASAGGERFSYEEVTDQITFGQWATSDTYKIGSITFTNGPAWSLADIKNRPIVFNGTEAVDTLTGLVGSRNTISGLGGNDTLTGQALDDTLDGGTGNDILNGAAGNDTLFGGTGDDTLGGSDGSDILTGDAGNERAVHELHGQHELHAGPGLATDHEPLDLPSGSKAR